MKLYILNGPNLNMLGIREPEHYGKETYAELENKIKAHCEGKCEVEIKQSNCEGKLVTMIQNAYFDGVQGIVINLKTERNIRKNQRIFSRRRKLCKSLSYFSVKSLYLILGH